LSKTPTKGDERDLKSAEDSEIDLSLPWKLVAEYPASGFGITRLVPTLDTSLPRIPPTLFLAMDSTVSSTGQFVDSVDLRILKDFALNLPSHVLLRELLLAEPDQMRASDFLKKLPLWLRLKPFSSIEN